MNLLPGRAVVVTYRRNIALDRIVLFVVALMVSACSSTTDQGQEPTNQPANHAVQGLCSSAPTIVGTSMGIPEAETGASLEMTIADLDLHIEALEEAGETDLAGVGRSVRDALADVEDLGPRLRVFFVDQAGDSAVGILTNRLGDVPGVQSIKYSSKEDAYKEWLLLTEGVEWAQGIASDDLPASLDVQFEGGTQVSQALVTRTRQARGVRDLSLSKAGIDPVTLAAFRRAVVAACPDITLWPVAPEPSA